mmetsp:Transcript_26313/g.54957  ORF Transcript_26313/g.54957 Transcript_26313/m.54957 type:complete len:207 (+) Transcript_26313:2028-2648(+)
MQYRVKLPPGIVGVRACHRPARRLSQYGVAASIKIRRAFVDVQTFSVQRHGSIVIRISKKQIPLLLHLDGIVESLPFSGVSFVLCEIIVPGRLRLRVELHESRTHQHGSRVPLFQPQCAEVIRHDFLRHSEHGIPGRLRAQHSQVKRRVVFGVLREEVRVQLLYGGYSREGIEVGQIPGEYAFQLHPLGSYLFAVIRDDEPSTSSN